MEPCGRPVRTGRFAQVGLITVKGTVNLILFDGVTLTASKGITVAEARGVCILVAKQHNIPIAEYTPLQIKQTLTGYGRAKKKDMQEAVRVYLKMEQIVKPDDAADALAAAITHALMTRIAYR